MVRNQLCLLALTFILAGGQSLFKKVGLGIAGLPPAAAMLAVLRDPLFYGSIGLYGFGTLLWIWILSRVPLSQAYPWVALGMVIVPLFGWYIFAERVAPMYWAGTVLMVAGLALIQYGGLST
jgi:drug/metabolite transporter (DMT)-like permease